MPGDPPKPRRGAFRQSRLTVMLCALLAALSLVHVSGVMPLALVARLELLFDDIRLRAFAPEGRSQTIAILDVDDKSLAALGRWPWSRARMAELVDALAVRQRVAAIGFDFVFPEADSAAYDALARAATTDPTLAARLPALRTQLDHDSRFAAALQRRPVVLGLYFSSDRGGEKAGVLPAPQFGDADLGGHAARLTAWNGFGANLAQLAQAAPDAGFINALPDEDGVTRSLPVITGFEGQYYQSLALALWRKSSGDASALRALHQPSWAVSGATDLTALEIGAPPARIRLALDSRGAVRVPFRARGGPESGSFPYVSAVDLLQGRVPDGALAGRIVLIGSSAPGLGDLRATPIHAAMPGVEVHAHLLSGLVEGRVPVRPDWAAGFEAIITLAMLLVTTALVMLGSAGVAVAAFGTLVGALVVSNLWAYGSAAWVLPLALPLVGSTLLFASGLAEGYVREWRARRSLTSMFGSYVPPEVVKKMASDGMRHDMHAENRELTLLFCDLRGFTTMAETLEPQALRTLINLYLSAMSAVVRAHAGTLDKFIGDAVMAFWGAPIDDPQHARHAVAAALAMAQATGPLNEQLRARGLPEVGVGVGLASGTVCVGDLGSDLRRSYTAVGDAVNIAARIEALTRQYGLDLLVGETTREACGDISDLGTWVEVDRLRVKGREKPVTLFTIVSAASDTAAWSVHLLRHWELALGAERSHHWELAREHLTPLMEAPELPTRLRALARTMSKRIDDGLARDRAARAGPA